MDVIDRVPTFGPAGAYLREHMANELIRHRRLHRHGAARTCQRSAGWEWEA